MMHDPFELNSKGAINNPIRSLSAPRVTKVNIIFTPEDRDGERSNIFNVENSIKSANENDEVHKNDVISEKCDTLEN